MAIRGRSTAPSDAWDDTWDDDWDDDWSDDWDDAWDDAWDDDWSGDSSGAQASTARSSRTAPVLSSGSLPLPHLGDCTQPGQPVSQRQVRTVSRVERSHSPKES